jgi:hypothetical protein
MLYVNEHQLQFNRPFYKFIYVDADLFPQRMIVQTAAVMFIINYIFISNIFKIN